MKKIAIYPGTFDPITYGHLDVLKRASKLFDEVIVGVAESTSKKTLFSIKERISIVEECVSKIKNVRVEKFSGLLVDYSKKKNASVIVRGLRAISDFEYEFQMALTNRKLSESISTVFLMPNEKFIYITSTLVKEIASYNGKLKDFVPPNVEKTLRRKYKAKPDSSSKS